MSRPKIVLPPDRIKAAPEYMVKVAKVATNGKMPITLTKTPLTSPPTKPTPKATVSAAGTLNPRVNKTAATMPAKEAIDPTDRSKSPTTITTVIATATTVSIETCCVMFSQLRAVMNVSGNSTQKTTIIAAMPISVP
jgi:hypothetical protein